MNRHHLIVLALAGGLTMAGLSATARAQTGDALVYAEHTCLDHGIAPNSAAFNACVERAAIAYDRGRPGLADREARSANQARRDCLRYGLEPYTLGYRYCVNNEIDRSSLILPVHRDPPYRTPPYRAPPYSAIVYPDARLIYMP